MSRTSIRADWLRIFVVLGVVGLSLSAVSVGTAGTSSSLHERGDLTSEMNESPNGVSASTSPGADGDRTNEIAGLTTNTSASRTTTVTLQEPQPQLLVTRWPGDTATILVVVSEAETGVGEYNLSISIENSDVARITNVTIKGSPPTSTTHVTDNSARIAASGVNTRNGSEVQVATIEVEFTTVGSTNLSVAVETLADETGDAYTVTETVGTSVSARGPCYPEDVEAGRTADPDADGVLEDLNCDGEVTPFDATILFNAIFAGEVPPPVAAFDINGDGEVTPGDATVLFNEVFEAS